MKTIENTNTIEKRYGKITVDSVAPSLNAKKHEAQVRQTVTSLYPGAKGSNSLSDALFADKAFGVGEAYDENRVAWIPVPIGTTIKQVELLLAKHPNARLVKTMSLNPILSEEQEQAMQNGVSNKTIADYRAKYVVDPQGEAVLYKGFPQYRNISFRLNAVEDIDTREQDLADMAEVTMTSSVPTEKF